MFYVGANAAHPMGCFYWASPAAVASADSSRKPRPQLPSQCLPVHLITDILIGKQSALLRDLSGPAASVPESCCLTLQSAAPTADGSATLFELNISAGSNEQLTAWLSALNHVIGSSSIKKLVETDAPSAQLSISSMPAHSVSSSSTNLATRRFSLIAPPPVPMAVPIVNGGANNSVAAPSSLVRLTNNGALRMIHRGKNFTQHFIDPVTGKPTAQPVFLFYSSHGSKPSDGALYWNPRAPLPASPLSQSFGDLRVENSSRCLPVSRLSDVLVGKQSGDFTAEARAENCFTLVGYDSSSSLGARQLRLSLEAGSSEDLFSWLASFNDIIEAAGKRVLGDVDSLTNPASQSFHQVSEPERPRSYSIVSPPDLPSVSEAPFRLSGKISSSEGAASVRALQLGSLWSLYRAVAISATGDSSPTSQIIREDAFLWYDPQAVGPLGAIYWAPILEVKKAGQNLHLLQRPDRCLPLHLCTDVYLGKQAMAFRSPIALSAKEQNCASIIAGIKGTNQSQQLPQPIAFHIEAKRPEQLATWLAALDSVLKKSGQIVLEGEKQSSSGIPNRRFSIRSSDVPSSGHVSQSVIGVAPGHNIALLAAGKHLTQYEPVSNDSSQIIRARRFLWLDSESSSLFNLLRWCRSEDASSFNRSKSESSQLTTDKRLLGSVDLRLLSSLSLGKQSALLSSSNSVTASAVDSRCLTLTFAPSTSQFSLNFELDSDEERISFVLSITDALTALGRVLYLQAPNFYIARKSSSKIDSSAISSSEQFTAPAIPSTSELSSLRYHDPPPDSGPIEAALESAAVLLSSESFLQSPLAKVTLNLHLLLILCVLNIKYARSKKIHGIT